MTAASILSGCNNTTSVSIDQDMFLINGEYTYKGCEWRGNKIEGLLMNSRMVQGIFDDYNPKTVSLFAYPDTKKWDPDRNTDEFIDAMKSWKSHGLLAFTLNMQGGSPFGYKYKPVKNPAYTPEGELISEYMNRLKRILDAANDNGMVVILGYFYVSQDRHLKDEQAVINATKNLTEWILDNGYQNVMVEVANECDLKFHHPIIKAQRVHELIKLIKSIQRDGKRLLVSTSFSGCNTPTPEVAKESDFILLHGNGMKDPKGIIKLAKKTRKMIYPVKKPILINEDDHFDFEKDTCNFTASIFSYVSWGYFDYRMEGEGFDEGYQSLPVNWEISSNRKKAFFEKLKEITRTIGD